MYKGLESKFLTVCNHVLICLSMCQGVWFICTYCLSICVRRHTNCTCKFGAMWSEHKPKFYVCPHAQHVCLTGWLPASQPETLDPWAWWNLTQLNSMDVFSQLENDDRPHIFEDAEFMNHFPSATNYLQGKIQMIFWVQIYFPPLTAPPLAFPGVTDVPHHMARKHLWHRVIVFRM